MKFDMFGSAQALELRPSGVGTTRRLPGATPAPRFCETNPIFFDWKTWVIILGYKVLEIKNTLKTFGFVLENEANFRGVLRGRKGEYDAN